MSAKRTWLIVGGDGRFGRVLTDALRNSAKPFLSTTRRIGSVSDDRPFLDLSADVANWRPTKSVSVAYLCAAVTKTGVCRAQPERSALVNVHNTAAVAETLARDGAFLVYPSTNQVFDGRADFSMADDTAAPRTQYGSQKLQAEQHLLALGNTAVLRLPKVITTEWSLLNEWITALQSGEVIHPLSDLVMAPVSMSLAVDVLIRLGEARSRGIFQLTAFEDISYAEAAAHVADRLGVSRALVQPVPAAESALTLEWVPPHTTLDSTRLKEEFGIEPPDPWAAIDEYLSSVGDGVH